MLERIWAHAIVFDPGESTGVVTADWPVMTTVDWSTVIWVGATITEAHLQGWLQERGTRFVRECAHRGEPLTAIVERPPAGAREPGGAARLIAEWLVFVGSIATTAWVSPGEWKPWIKANPLPPLPKTSQHERDAANLLRWWLSTKRVF